MANDDQKLKEFEDKLFGEFDRPDAETIVIDYVEMKMRGVTGDWCFMDSSDTLVGSIRFVGPTDYNCQKDVFFGCLEPKEIRSPDKKVPSGRYNFIFDGTNYVIGTIPSKDRGIYGQCRNINPLSVMMEKYKEYIEAKGSILI